MTLVATGTMVGRSLLAADAAGRRPAIAARVLEIHTVKPLDEELILPGGRGRRARW